MKFNNLSLPRACAMVLACPLVLLCSVLHAAIPTKTLVNNEWAMITLPADPGSSGTVRNLFADDLPVAGYGDSWILYAYQPPVGSATTGSYPDVTLDTVLEPGLGYWMIQVTGNNVTIDIPASTPDTQLTQERGCNSVVGCFEVPLTAKAGTFVWNMAGFASDTPIRFGDTRVSVSANPVYSEPCSPSCSPDDAAIDGENIMNNLMYTWRGGPAYEQATSDTDLQPWDAYWVPVLEDAAGKSPVWLLPEPTPQTTLPNLANYTLAFSDEFNGPTLDQNKWNTGFLWGPYVTINNEEQVYVDINGLNTVPAYSSNYNPFQFMTYPNGDSTLKIVADRTSAGMAAPNMPPNGAAVYNDYQEYRHNPDYNPANVDYLSGLINSYEAFKFAHGYAEARVKLPKGQGFWPAFWLLNTHYIEDFPEIDIMEALGHRSNEVYHTYHQLDQGVGYTSSPTFETLGPDFSEEFHTFGAVWEPTQIIWYVDGIETQRIQRDADNYDIANQAMYVLANLAVGGSWPGSPDANTQFPAEYEIDYIRVYKRNLRTPVNLADYQLMFSDEFSGNTLDTQKWNTRFLWGPWLTINNEEQYYIDANGLDQGLGYSPFAVSGGNLTITARNASELSGGLPAQPAANSSFFANAGFNHAPAYSPRTYTSGIITSYDSFKFTHGYAEMRAQVPLGDGLWPAFWLLNAYYVAQQPEIDIMEIRGENPGEVVHTYHYLNDQGLVTSIPYETTGGSPGTGYADGFHTYGVQWQAGEITWYVDGVATHTLSDPDVAYQVMYVLANLAVGGDFNYAEVDPSAIPAEFVIDYIRVYQESATP